MIGFFSTLRFAAAAVLAAALLAAPVFAQDTIMLGAENCKKMAPGAPIEIIPENDNALENGIKDDFRAKLSERGHGAEKPAAYRFLYRTETRQLEEHKGGTGIVQSYGTTAQGQEVFVHLWRSNDNSVLGGNRAGRRSANYATYLMLIVEVSDNRDGSCIWRGRAMSRAEGWRYEDLAGRMVAPLMARFGKKVEREDFVIK
jgi:hypothetical protein